MENVLNFFVKLPKVNLETKNGKICTIKIFLCTNGKTLQTLLNPIIHGVDGFDS
ncbi:hypothetical protein [Pediococcus pentosaceus]|uniref:hypothetical protein n=1 Tax=Pediococcus pentosaceus TaxID=1255 RepID=UPI0018FEE99F|nr:hypothetical protein [Pediococcus pentosaceus]MBF7121625.1 hypothetical protein [Pediococcus pentosaceus]MCI2961449.1 hypothetical protein [Pediococcus pentosaceus]MCL3859375.1 hypothetical protein [Pediococcus pentosaceus]